MTWEFSPTLDASATAAITGKKGLVYRCAPAWWATLPLFERLDEGSVTGLRNLVVVPDGPSLAEAVSRLSAVHALRPVHAATGLTRTAKLIGAQRIRTLVLPTPDALELIKRSALDVGSIGRVIVGWPEMQLSSGLAETLETVLAECRSAQRVLIVTDPQPLDTFLERHAHRAVVVDATDSVEVGDVAGRHLRYSITSADRLASAARATLDVLNPNSAHIWDPVSDRHEWWIRQLGDPAITVSADEGAEQVELAIGVEVPTRGAFAALQKRAKEVAVLIAPWQLPYLRTLGPKPRSLRLPTEADRAPHRARQLRDLVRDRIAQGEYDLNLLALAPLFDEYDPATVAAAAAQLAAQPAEPPPVASWVRLRVTAGRDRIRTGDLVGVLLNSVGLARDQVGRVTLRERFATVEIRADVAERTRKELDGMMVRGHRLAAKIDRR